MACQAFDLIAAEPAHSEDSSTLMRETFLAAYGHVAPADSIDRYMRRA